MPQGRRKEFIERQSDGQEIDLLRYKMLVRRQVRRLFSKNSVAYIFVIQGKWGVGEDHLLPHPSGRPQAHITSSSFVLGRRVFDPMTSN